MKSQVWVTTKFVGFHRWMDAPDGVAFLRDWHRHVFHVRLTVSVKHADRDVEFFTLKKELDEYLSQEWEGRQFHASCEMIAESLVRRFSADSAEVSEDGENGAVVTAPPNVRFRPFFGTEAEGPLRGTPTLFIPGGCAPADVWRAADECARRGLRPAQVYYGAGNDLAFIRVTYDACRHLANSLGAPLTAEVASMGPVAASGADVSDARTVSLSPRDGAEFYKVYAGAELVWYGRYGGPPYVTRLDDPLYAEDTFV